uniref:Protein FAM98B n=1 Tax=Neogobius melanostomus TaxID=47308 RepID=A0A8C6T3K3_9GOBI
MNRTLGAVSAIKSAGYPGRECVSRCDCDELPCPLLSWICGQLKLHCPELKGLSHSLLLFMVDSSMWLTIKFAWGRCLDYFLSELQAAIINKHQDNQSEERTTEEEPPKEQRCVTLIPEEHCQEYEDCMASANKQAEWELVLKSLNMDANSHITDILKEVQLRITNLPSDTISPLLNTSLTPEQWVKLEKINDILSSDYKCRRQMMVKRFQVTLESFGWGDKVEERRKVLDMIPPIASLDGTTNVSLPLVLAARVNLSCIEPIRPGKTTSVYKVKMGEVPDRGGRPGEIEPPMPSWEARKSGQRSGRGGGGHKERRFGDKKKKKH